METRDKEMKGDKVTTLVDDLNVGTNLVFALAEINAIYAAHGGRSRESPLRFTMMGIGRIGIIEDSPCNAHHARNIDCDPAISSLWSG